MKKLATAVVALAIIAAGPALAAKKPAPAAAALPTAAQVTVDAQGKCHWGKGTGHNGYVACPAGVTKAAAPLKAHKDKAGKCQYDPGQAKKGYAPAALCK